MSSPPWAGAEEETMNYTFECQICEKQQIVEAPMSVGPPEAVDCCDRNTAHQVIGVPSFICRSDPDEIPDRFQTADVGGGIAADGSLLPTTHAQVVGPSKAQARKRERRYQEHINDLRRLYREEDQPDGRMTHSVPPELYHGKIAQTGDPDYWRDEANLRRHTSCKVS